MFVIALRYDIYDPLIVVLRVTLTHQQQLRTKQTIAQALLIFSRMNAVNNLDLSAGRLLICAR
jgi:hypothetical protein